MHTLYTYEDSDEEKVDCSIAGTRPIEYWHDEMEAPSVPDRSTRSKGSCTYSLQYHAGDFDPKKSQQQQQENVFATPPEYWYQDIRRLNTSGNESRKHTALILWVIVSTFLLGFVVGHFIWVPQQTLREVTTYIDSTEAPTTTTGE
jgi:hypothetical protein